eukprot:SAG31_NODE_61_length_29286_cov_444.645973_15_plen_64_part_00
MLIRCWHLNSLSICAKIVSAAAMNCQAFTSLAGQIKNQNSVGVSPHESVLNSAGSPDAKKSCC